MLLTLFKRNELLKKINNCACFVYSALAIGWFHSFPKLKISLSVDKISPNVYRIL
jgi:hypothetical protein